MRIIIDVERDGTYTVRTAGDLARYPVQHRYLTSVADDVYQRMSKGNTVGARWWIVVDPPNYCAITTGPNDDDLSVFDSTNWAEIYHTLKAHLQMMRGE